MSHFLLLLAYLCSVNPFFTIEERSILARIRTCCSALTTLALCSLCLTSAFSLWQRARDGLCLHSQPKSAVSWPTDLNHHSLSISLSKLDCAARNWDVLFLVQVGSPFLRQPADLSSASGQADAECDVENWLCTLKPQAHGHPPSLWRSWQGWQAWPTTPSFLLRGGQNIANADCISGHEGRILE